MEKPLTSVYLEASTGASIEVFTASLDKDPKKVIIKQILKEKNISLRSAPELTLFIMSNLLDGNVFPYSQRQVARMSGRSVGAVNRVMKELMANGIIKQVGNACIVDNDIAELCRLDKKSIGILYK